MAGYVPSEPITSDLLPGVEDLAGSEDDGEACDDNPTHDQLANVDAYVKAEAYVFETADPAERVYRAQLLQLGLAGVTGREDLP